jgi:hypothetical protein
MEAQMDKTKMLENIQAEHDRLVSLLAPLSEAQLCSATLEGGWSIKDIMAHVAAWERMCAGWIEAYIRGEIPQTWSEDNDDIVNERIFRENQHRSLHEVQEDFPRAHQTFLQQVQALTDTLSEKDLNKPHPFSWLEGHSFVELIAANSYNHYRDHEQQIRTWLDNTQAQ